MTSPMQEELRPVLLSTGEPLPLTKQPGYYPGYRTLSQQNFWDAATRNVITDRVQHIPPIRFLSKEQAELLELVCGRVLPQDDRDPDFRIPIVPQIDQRLYEDKGPGYRFEDMPPDGEAYTLGLKAIGDMAHEVHGKPFAEIGVRAQEELLYSLHQSKPLGACSIWDRMSVHRFWMLLVQDCVEAYYAHPWAWDEIGYGGPAYPRAYMRLERGEPEPWEVKEKRYEWRPPSASISGEFSALVDEHEHAGMSGQEGTH